MVLNDPRSYKNFGKRTFYTIKGKSTKKKKKNHVLWKGVRVVEHKKNEKLAFQGKINEGFFVYSSRTRKWDYMRVCVHFAPTFGTKTLSQFWHLKNLVQKVCAKNEQITVGTTL